MINYEDHTQLLLISFRLPVLFIPELRIKEKLSNLNQMKATVGSRMMISSNLKFSASLAIWARNSPVTGEFSSQKPVTWSFDVFFDQRMNKRLSKQSWGWWFETPWLSLWRHCNGNGVSVRATLKISILWGCRQPSCEEIDHMSWKNCFISWKITEVLTHPIE